MNDIVLPLYYKEKTGEFKYGNLTQEDTDFELINTFTDDDKKLFIGYVNENKKPLPLKTVMELYNKLSDRFE